MNFIHTVTNSEVDVSDLMIEQEVKFGPKTGLEAVQNGEHAVVGMASSDDKTKPSRPRDRVGVEIKIKANLSQS